MSLNNFATDYLARLNLTHQRPSLENVMAIQSSHISEFSFNSLAVVLNQTLPLDTQSLMEKIVYQGRGGYCFEHNKLLFDVLTTLGYLVRPLLARVVYNRDIDAPKTHRLTLLDWHGTYYIVDAGFGHLGPRYPIKLDGGNVDDQGDASYRIIQDKQGDYLLQIFKDGGFFTLYRFDLARYTEADCVLSHFYSHKYPQAGFVNNLVVAKKLSSETRSLRNHEYHLTRRGHTEIVPVTGKEHLRQLLSDEFDLDVDQAVSEFLYNQFVCKHKLALSG